MITGKIKNKNYKILVVKLRNKKNPAEMHEKADDLYFVLEGSAKLTLGGKIIGKQKIRNGEYIGNKISSGKTIILKKGDVVSIVRKTPHLMDATSKKIKYAVVKIYGK